MLCLQSLRSLGAAQGARAVGCAGLGVLDRLCDVTSAPYSSRSAHSKRDDVHSTTVLCVRKDGQASSLGSWLHQETGT